MKRLLVVVDYQNDFVDGALGFPGAEKLEQPIVDKIAEYRENFGDIAFTFDTHSHDYLETQEGRNLPIEHCIEGTPGHDLYGAVADAKHDSDKVFYKSSFGSSEFFEWLYTAEQTAEQLATAPFESIEFVGLVSNMCVLSNALLAKSACPEVPIIVDAACTASNDPKLHEEALDVLEGLQVQVINR